MNKVKATQAVRQMQVVDVGIRHVKSGEVMFPSFAVGKDANEVWVAMLSTREGLLPVRHTDYYFGSQAAADRFKELHAPGTLIERDNTSPKAYLEWIREVVDAKAPIGGGVGGDSESPLALDVLVSANVLDQGYGISKQVSDFIGKRRIAALKRGLGENWRVGAELEFCFAKLPHSSPAYVAALYRYHYYITGDDFAAGYLWRDLECLIYGVETAALSTTAMRQTAGKKGSESSKAQRERRRSHLMDTLEDIARRNPDLAHLGGKDTLAELAVVKCRADDPTLWATGSRQAGGYLAEIQSGQAGPGLQARYFSLFPSKGVPLKKKSA